MRPIYIVGYMGAGKSTFGRKLAELLGYKFIDTDIFIENRFRERIVDMFDRIGEANFRRREQVVIEELSGMTDSIISTGGGLPCYHGNMNLMNESGITIYLSASDETLAQRLECCKRTRPSIRHKEGRELLKHIVDAMLLRRPIYEQAQIQISIDELQTETDETTLANTIAQRILNFHDNNK